MWVLIIPVLQYFCLGSQCGSDILILSHDDSESEKVLMSRGDC